MASETNVVVPTISQMMWPRNIHEMKAPISSVLNGLKLRIENHLKRIPSRCQKLVAAARSSSFVGLCRWDRCGKRSRRCLGTPAAAATVFAGSESYCVDLEASEGRGSEVLLSDCGVFGESAGGCTAFSSFIILFLYLSSLSASLIARLCIRWAENGRSQVVAFDVDFVPREALV